MALVEVSNSRAGKDFNRATAEPGLTQKEKVSGFLPPTSLSESRWKNTGKTKARVTIPNAQSVLPRSESLGRKVGQQRAVVLDWH